KQKTAYEIFTCLEFRRVLFRSALLGLLERKNDLVRAERLRDVVVGALLHRLDREIHPAVRGHDDDHRLAVLRLVALEELEAVQARHADIAQDDVGLELDCLGEPLLTVARRRDLVSLLAQDERDRVTQPWLVVDDQDVHTSAGSGVNAGSNTTNCAPPASASSVRSTPPIVSISRADTARPRPVPFP